MSRKTVVWFRRVIGFYDNKLGVLTAVAKGTGPLFAAVFAYLVRLRCK